MRGHFPCGPVANKEHSFILLHTSADKRNGGVSGALRGGRETGRGARALDSSLATCYSPLDTRHSPLSSRPAASWRERARKSRTGMDRASPCALPAPLTPFRPPKVGSLRPAQTPP
jgi:hypothetical protein